jgi:hypothetical protein
MCELFCAATGIAVARRSKARKKAALFCLFMVGL